MTRKFIIAVVVLAVVTWVLDFLIHGVLLRSLYEATPDLWRPPEEMNPLGFFVLDAVLAAIFALTYLLLVGKKSPRNGVLFGALIGLMWGISMGAGTYLFMPIPASIAWGWFVGSLVMLTVNGAIVGAIIRESGPAPAA